MVGSIEEKMKNLESRVFWIDIRQIFILFNIALLVSQVYGCTTEKSSLYNKVKSLEEKVELLEKK